MRLIDADKFLSQIEDQYMEHDITREKYVDLSDRIMQQPIIEERKKGKWIPYVDEDGERYGDKCSECGARYVMPDRKTNYCPDCGADMRGEQDERSD